MSAAVYSEPHKLPAGILALAIHGVFLALLYFSVSWQAQPPQGMVVDIWESLPELNSVPAQTAPPPAQKAEPPKPAKQASPAALPKADIELAAKKKQQEAEKLALETKKAAAQKKEAERRKAEAERLAQAEREAQAEQERARAEQAAALGKIIDEHVGKIRAKIRRNITEPPNLPASAHGKFNITVLPGGTVLNVKLVRSSGFEAYDIAVERAILKSQPLPVPEDVTLFQKFRELSFPFCPDQGGGKCEE